MNSAANPAAVSSRQTGLALRVFAGAFGAFLGLCLLKFGNPPILEGLIIAPGNGFELLFWTRWPIAWAYVLLGALLLLGLVAVWRSRANPDAEAERGHSGSRQSPTAKAPSTISKIGRPLNVAADRNVRAPASGVGAAQTAPPRHGIPTRRRFTAWRLIVLLPLAWVLWEFLAGIQGVDADRVWATLVHFAACVVCFYLGFFCLGRLRELTVFWTGLLCGLVLLLAVGLDQHFGGLSRNRPPELRAVLEKSLHHPLVQWPPITWDDEMVRLATPVCQEFSYHLLFPDHPGPPPPDFINHSSSDPVLSALLHPTAESLRRLYSDRIFSTQFYPNALAGVLLLLLPASLAMLWRVQPRIKSLSRTAMMLILAGLTAAAIWLYLTDSKVGLAWTLALGLAAVLSAPRWVVAGLLGLAGLACLYWSGSKTGWLLMLVMGLVVLLQLPFRKHYKFGLVAAVLLVGLAGFFWRYSGFFERGASSVVARFDYWRAALQTLEERPLFGTGPGTFGLAYEKVKRPESEPTRLTHNDYLEQGSDSGLPGMLLYGAFVVGALVEIRRPKSGFSPTSAVSGPWPVADGAGTHIRHPASSQRPAPVGTQHATRNTLSEPQPSSALAKAANSSFGSTRFWVWLGVLGWALQGFMEFGLYIPALAWPAFAFLGWLLRVSKEGGDE